MRPSSEATEPVETYSPAEERFNRRRRTAGLIAGPLIFAAILLWPAPGLPPAAHRLAAVLGLMITLWMTEALPLPVTALARSDGGRAARRRTRPRGVRAVCRSDHLSLHRQLHAGRGDVRPSSRPPARVQRARVEVGGSERASTRRGLRARRVRAVDVDEQHGDDGDAVSARVGGARRAQTGARTRSRVRAVRDGDDARHVLCRVDWRNGHAGRHAAQPDRQGVPPAGRREHLVCRLDGAVRAADGHHHGVRRGLAARAARTQSATR